MSSQKAKLKLDWCSHEASKYAVMRWHYSKRMPVGKLVKIGVWENSSFIGCVIYGLGNNRNIGAFLKLQNIEICELVRVALNKHITPVSKIIAISLKMLKKQSPGLKAVISYADPEEGHIGSIYQAGNWFYCGQSASSVVYILNGKEIHHRVADPGKTQFGRKAKRPKGIELAIKKKKTPKYKYVYPLTKEIRRQLIQLSKDYPKRSVSSSDGAAPGFQSGKGGSSPTGTLQLRKNAHP